MTLVDQLFDYRINQLLLPLLYRGNPLPG